MNRFNMRNAATPALFVVPPKGGVEVAAFKSATGDVLVCNANMEPYSPTDGAPMQKIASEVSHISAADIRKQFVGIGSCPSCASELRATASMADAIEISSAKIHCVMCSADVTPIIDTRLLTAALAAEVGGDEDDDELDDGGADGDYDTDDGNLDLDSGDDDEASEEARISRRLRVSKRRAVAADEDGDLDEEEAPTEDDVDEEDVSPEEARLMRRLRVLKRHRVLAALDEDGIDESGGDDLDDAGAGDDEDYGDEDDATVASQRLLMASDEDGLEDEDGDTLDADSDDGDQDEEEDVASIRSLIRKSKKRRTRAVAFDDGDGDEDDLPGSTGDDDDDAGGDEDEEVVAAVAALRSDMRSMGIITASEEDGLDDEAVDTDVGDEDDGEDADAIEAASIRRRLRIIRRKRLHAGLEGEDDYGDDDAAVDSNGLSGDEEFPDEDVEEAAAAFRPFVQRTLRRRRIRALAGDEQPIAGEPEDDEDIDAINEEARDRIRERHFGKPDGNRHIRGTRSLASNDSRTPGTSGNPRNTGDGERDPGTPGSTRSPRNTDDGSRDELTVGTNRGELAGDAIVDWTTANIDIVSVASTPDTKWVHVDGRPVARLIKANASQGVVAQWDSPILVTAFEAAAKRGLIAEEASEFGFAAYRFKVQANDIMRNAMRRAASLSSRNAQNQVSRDHERYAQSVKVAALAAFKGTFTDLKNPMREALASSLARMSVAEPRTVIDQATAASIVPLLDAIFAKADEIYKKPDVARNEMANFVATSSFQGRSGPGAELAATLARGSLTGSNITAGQAPAVPRPSEATASGGSDTSTQVRAALRSIR